MAVSTSCLLYREVRYNNAIIIENNAALRCVRIAERQWRVHGHSQSSCVVGVGVEANGNFRYRSSACCKQLAIVGYRISSVKSDWTREIQVLHFCAILRLTVKKSLSHLYCESPANQAHRRSFFLARTSHPSGSVNSHLQLNLRSCNIPSLPLCSCRTCSMHTWLS